MFDDDDDKPTMIRPSDQGDMWELAQYIEEHPDDHEERWRLAKKMYLSWEYRHALEHLLVLKNEWSPRLNVLRYLAATYYRLGRYEEAIGELEQALARWPEEVGLREQLARVKEIAGDRLGATKEWQQIAEINPEHPTANSAIRRLHAVPQNTPKEDLGLMESDSGVPLKVGVVCPQCGAQNSADEARCWQCNEPLGAITPQPRRRRGQATPLAAGPSIETLVTLVGAVGLVLLLINLYLSVRLVLEDHSSGANVGYQTLEELYRHGMAKTRIALGVALYAGWPLALWIAMSFYNVKLRIPPAFVTLTGFVVAGIAYLCTWLPLNALALFVLLPPGTAALFIFGVYRLSTRESLMIWGSHLAIMAVVLPTVFIASERVQLGMTIFNPIAEATRVLAFSGSSSEDSFASSALPDTEVPIAQRMRWESTGSEWLDRRAGSTLFEVTTSSPAGLIFEIKEEGQGTRLYEDITSNIWKVRFNVSPNKVYEIIVRRKDRGEGTVAEVDISGVMRHALVP